MIKFILGVIVGITLVTIGVDGTVKIIDGGVTRVQSAARAAAQ